MKRNPPYLIEYQYAGERWSITIWAKSWQDAQRRLVAIGANGQVIGSDAHNWSCGPAVALVVDNVDEQS